MKLQRPNHINRKYPTYMGVDIARMGRDKGTYEIIQKQGKRLIHIQHMVTKKKLTTETEDKILYLDKVYNFKKIYLDAGSGTLGVSIFDHLLINDQTKRKIVAINNLSRPLDKDGKKKQGILKEDLYDNLKSLMERHNIDLLDDDDIFLSLKSVQYEYVQKQGQKTKMRIFGADTHTTEGLIRASWCVKEKDLNMRVYCIRV